MNKSDLLREAKQFRKAIEKARDADEFAPKGFKPERMNEFPNDCCDDTADLFTHYLYQKFKIDSIRIDGRYYDNRLKCMPNMSRTIETADSYIEKTVHAIAKESDVTVATSDAAEQIIIWGSGARRLSARELRDEIRETCREIQELYLKVHPGGKVYLFDHLSEDLSSFLEDVRLGRRCFDEQ